MSRRAIRTDSGLRPETQKPATSQVNKSIT